MDTALLICLIIALAAMSVVSGEQCYNCAFSKDCEDKFDAKPNQKHTVSCDMKTSACAKIKTGSYVARFCLPGCKATSDYSYGGKKGQLLCCTGNKCNGTTTVRATVGLLLMTVLLSTKNLF